jgi:hypothetical protein
VTGILRTLGGLALFGLAMFGLRVLITGHLADPAAALQHTPDEQAHLDDESTNERDIWVMVCLPIPSSVTANADQDNPVFDRYWRDVQMESLDMVRGECTITIPPDKQQEVLGHIDDGERTAVAHGRPWPGGNTWSIVSPDENWPYANQYWPRSAY